MAIDRILGVGFVVLGVTMVWLMSRLQEPSLGQGDPGAALLPTALGVAIAVLGGVLAIRSSPDEDKAEPGNSEVSEAAIIVPAEPPLLSVLHLINLCAYAALFERLGFSLSSFLFLAVAIFLLGKRSLRGLLIALLAAALFTFIVGTTLKILIGVPLPGVFLG